MKIGIIAAAAAVLCAITAATAVAITKAPKDIIVDDEPAEVEYTVYKDEHGREIRTYSYNLPDYALRAEKPGCTPVGKVRVVHEDGYLWTGWRIVDEKGNEFPDGINNKEILCEVIDKYNPHTYHEMGFGCTNFRGDEYNMMMFHKDDLDEDNLPDKFVVYVYRYDDEEEYKRILEKDGKEYTSDEAERFRENLERHSRIYSPTDDTSEDTSEEE